MNSFFQMNLSLIRKNHALMTLIKTLKLITRVTLRKEQFPKFQIVQLSRWPISRTGPSV